MNRKINIGSFSCGAMDGYYWIQFGLYGIEYDRKVPKLRGFYKN